LDDNKAFFWPLVSVVFVFTQVLAKGFYNFTFSMALLMWLIAIWLQYLEKRNKRDLFFFFFLSLFTFFTHPVAFVFGCISCFALTGSYAVSGALVTGNGSKLKSLLRYELLLCLCLAPATMLFAWFASGQGGPSLQLKFYHRRLWDLPDFISLVNLCSRENVLLHSLFFLLVVLFLSSLTIRFRKKPEVHRYDGFLLTFLLTLIVYFFFPDALFGGSIFIIRVQYLLAVIAVCCIAYQLPTGRIKQWAGVVIFVGFIVLSFIRMSYRQAVADGEDDFFSASAHIRPFSVVMPLDFSPGGLNRKGLVITDRNWLFTHAAQYLGTLKPLIVLDNYEANTGYFPLVWKEAVNPYNNLGNIEAGPPVAKITDYKNKTGVTIDYVLMWCYEDKWLSDTQFRKLYSEIMVNYRLVYKSESGRVLLYERK
jgi:hypothetical protein